MNDKLTTNDVKILSAIQQDGTMTTQEIADKINMSQSPCWRRIHRLEADGVIERRVALLNREKLGMEIVAFATINLSMQGRNSLEDFEREVEILPEVLECYTMAGTWDYMLKIVVKDIRHYEKFVR
ncbi:MAG: Lrp/AsnC family transcriptional regulator, partial [Candidatus Azotimanducaceae bacterium]